MKATKYLAAMLLAPLLFLITATADEKEKKDAETDSKPSLTYYYLDG